MNIRKRFNETTNSAFRGGVVGLLLIALLAQPLPAANNYRDATSGFLNEQTLAASAARTADGAMAAVVDLGAYNAGNLFIGVTTVSGTASPTLTVYFQSCPTTTVADCIDHTTATAITATGNTLVKVTNFGRYVLVRWTISGTTPSFTFSVKGAFKPTT